MYLLAAIQKLWTHRSKKKNHKLNRDQRSELKQLQQSMLTSAQQTFEAEVWSGCGVEADHLKRQELGKVLGLSFNLNGKMADT